MDLRACIAESQTMPPGDTILIPTGIAINIGHPGLAAIILPRSGPGQGMELSSSNLA